MEANPAQFEAIGNRLGFRIVEETPEILRLVWQGPRFPAFLCLGIALLLLFLSIPIVQALNLRGFVGPAGSLWYFPLMNLILLGIAVYLLSQKRVIVIDRSAQTITLARRNVYQTKSLSVSYHEIRHIRLGVDLVYSGFAVAGSSAAESFPVPSLRLVTKNGAAILLDRGSRRRLEDMGKRITERLGQPLEIEPSLSS
jgi:hypothetical protein